MLIGQLAALGTSLCFSIGSTFFTLAGRAVSSMVVNRTRLILATIFLSAAHWLFHIPLPFYAERERVFWLGLSGVIGLALGDAFLFQAFVWIGPRLSMLMMSLAPVMAALMGWFFLDEYLTNGQILGIFLTIFGIAWVVLERNNQSLRSQMPSRQYGMGILFGLLAAFGQAAGLITAKFGLAGDFPAISGTLIRMVAAAAVIWLITLIQRKGIATITRIQQNPKALGQIAIAAFLGPTLGVTLSLVAIQRIPVGIASTLTALPPVFLLPISYFVFGERFGWQAVLGTLLAIAGVALLFLV